MSMFLYCGGKSPYFTNVSASIAYYFSPPQRHDLRAICEEYRESYGDLDARYEALLEVLDHGAITAWATNADNEDIYSRMEQGDAFLLRTGYHDTADRYFRYVQQVDHLVGESYPREMRERLAEAIWGDDSYTLLWFSHSPIVEIEATETEFGETVRAADSSHSSVLDWFGDQNFKEAKREWLTHYNGPVGFIEALDDDPRVRLSGDVSNYRLLHVGEDSALRWYTEPPHLGPIHITETGTGRGTPLKDLRAIRNDAAVLIYTDGAVVGQARLGYVGADDRDDISGTSATLVDYQALEDSMADLTAEQLMEWQNRVDQDGPITEISAEEFDQVGDRSNLFPQGSAIDPVRSSDDGGFIDALVDRYGSPGKDNGPGGTANSFTAWFEAHRVFDDVGPPSQSALYFPSDGVEPPLLNQIDDALRNGKHLILTGPPGSGKTELAKLICEHYVGDDYELATATDDWSTFDTIGGYRPQEGDTLEFRPGVFLRRFLTTDGGLMAPKQEWLIVDELNRADIDKAFGSLFSALTGNSVTLPFEEDGEEIKLIGDPLEQPATPIKSTTYYVSPDWRLIATMNTDDKASLYRLSYAFMRRFAFITVPVPEPNDIQPELIREYVDRWDLTFPAAHEIDIDGSIDVETAILEAMAAIWSGVQRRNPIGPAIVRDMLTHTLTQLRAGGPLDYTPAVQMYVFPQLEGMSKRDITSLINEITNTVDALDRDQLAAFSEDYLGVPIDDE